MNIGEISRPLRWDNDRLDIPETTGRDCLLRQFSSERDRTKTWVR